MADTLTACSALVARDGRRFVLDVARWMAPADPVDEALLDRAEGPVLDVGCGPGRHVGSLRRRGVEAVGLEIAPTAVALARRRGAPVLHRSVFDEVPGRGRWRTALLLDGSIGIGGDPLALLRRVGELLGSCGRVLIEAEPPDCPTEMLWVRLETPRSTSPWFRWARVSARDVPGLARSAGYESPEPLQIGGRHFTLMRLARCGAGSAGRAAPPDR
jgi:SAM-dependent methyltransferase